MGIDANALTLRTLFLKPVQYVIPDFQRPYVWNREDQWEPLWDDVQHAADRFLAERMTSRDDAEAESRAGRHFLGAIVLKQRMNSAAAVEFREVIDGQQRITTLQLLLAAAHRVAQDRGIKGASLLKSLVENDVTYSEADPDQILKVLPTAMDREVFTAVMAAESQVEADSHQIAEAFEYFQNRTADWLGLAGDDPSSRMAALQTALLGLLQVVVIDLDASDDAFVIFETLNARGTELLAADLVKNHLIQAAESHGDAIRQGVRKEWKALEKRDWRTEIRQGRATRQRIEIFLDYWLELERHQEVSTQRVFSVFKELLVEVGDPLVVVKRLRHFAGVYRQIDKPTSGTFEEVFHYRWNQLDARVATPMLMWLHGWAEDDLPASRRRRFLELLESYLIRRAIMRLTTKNYNVMFLELLARLDAEGPGSADDTLHVFLLQQTADARVWPADHEVRETMLDLQTYRLINRGRLRMILEALEDDYRGQDSEQPVIRKKLTVEHVMPQRWERHWPLPPSVNLLQAELDRNRLLHTYGNLTLATKSLNTRMSNHSWEDKRDHLRKHSVLLMTQGILEMAERSGGWSEEQIRARGEDLADRACRIWSRPEA